MAVGPGEGECNVGRGARGAVGENEGGRVGSAVGNGSGKVDGAAAGGTGVGAGDVGAGVGADVGMPVGNTDSDGNCVGCANTMPYSAQK